MDYDASIERHPNEQRQQQQVARTEPVTSGPKKSVIRKQNAISVTLTSASSITTTQLNEVPIPNTDVSVQSDSSKMDGDFEASAAIREPTKKTGRQDTSLFIKSRGHNVDEDDSCDYSLVDKLTTTANTTGKVPDTMQQQRHTHGITTNPEANISVPALRINKNISNVFFNEPNLNEDKPTKGEDEDSSSICSSFDRPISESEEPRLRNRHNKQQAQTSIVTHDTDSRNSQSSKVLRGLQSNFKQYGSTGVQNDIHSQARHPANLMLKTDQDASSRSATTSLAQVDMPTEAVPSNIFSLNVPDLSTSNRKLSLQPFSQIAQPGGDNGRPTKQHHHQPQQQPAFHGSLSSHQLFQMQYQQQTPQLNEASSNLQVKHLAPRKSIIGKLERPSFQSQRLSDVGVAFGQQITAKMGLKLPASQERIVEQTRWLYLRYVFLKLRRNRLPLKDLNLTKSSRARRAAALGEADQAQVTHSAPASANTMTDIASILNGFNVNAGGRRRTAMSHNIDIKEISNLAARKGVLETPSTDNNSNDNSTNQTNSINLDDLGAQIAAPNNYRRFVMDPTINNQIFTVIINIIRELRSMKPDFFGDTIYELVGIDKFSSIQNLLDVQRTICQEMTRYEISWCRIAALFSLFGAMSLDCVRLGAPEHVGPLLDGFIEFVERDLALWISQQGGWESFLYKYRAGYQYGELASKLATLTLPLLLWALVMLLRSSFT